MKINHGSSDIEVFSQIFTNQEYACMKTLGDVDPSIDCGANVGYSSNYLLSTFPGSRVIAIEADHDNDLVAQRNLAPCGDRVTLLHAGVWSRPTGLELRDDDYRDGREWSRQVRETPFGQEGSIEGIDLPSLIRMAGGETVSLLKMDIQGAEGEVFCERGAPQRWLPSVTAIAIELHEDTDFGPCREIFFQAIDQQGFRITSSGERAICVRE